MDGPYKPEEGHRFNPNKFLLDPYAKSIKGHVIWHDALYGYKIGDDKEDLSYDTQDSAPYMPRSVVVDPAFTWGRQERVNLDHPWNETILYEAHVKGLTEMRRDIPHKGLLGMASDPILEHLNDLGITAIELLPPCLFG